MIVERGARPDALPKPKRRQDRFDCGVGHRCGLGVGPCRLKFALALRSGIKRYPDNKREIVGAVCCALALQRWAGPPQLSQHVRQGKQNN